MYIFKTKNIVNISDFNDAAKALSPDILVVIKFGEDSLRFTLEKELTEAEDNAIDELLESFVDTVESVPLIISLAKAEAADKHFHNIDYKKELTVRLQKESTIVRGEVNLVTYYRNMSYDGYTRVYDTPVLKVETSWTRDSAEFAICKNPTVRTWFNEDGTENAETKVMSDPYYYEDFEQINEGVRRRSLLVKALQKPVLVYMLETLPQLGYTKDAIVLMGREFMDEYEDMFGKFIENSSTITDPANANYGRKTIIVSLEDETSDGHNADHNFWLDKAPASLGGATTIRQYLISEFSI